MAYVWDFNNKETYNNRYGRYKFSHQYGFILDHAPNKGSVLDVAGGAGRFALPLFAINSAITVVDINAEALALLRARSADIRIIEGDFMTVSMPENYTFVMCIEALNYFNDYDLFFQKINGLLDQEGCFVFMIVNPDSWRTKLRNFNKYKSDYNEITYTGLVSLLKAHQFTINEVRGFNWIPLPIRLSNSRLVTIFAFLEKKLKLGRWIAQSPWLMVSVTKT